MQDFPIEVVIKQYDITRDGWIFHQRFFKSEADKVQYLTKVRSAPIFIEDGGYRGRIDTSRVIVKEMIKDEQ